MYWKKTLGNALYEKVLEYLKDKKMTISMLVRIAVEEYIKK